MNIIPPTPDDIFNWEPGFKEAVLMIALVTVYWSGLLGALWPF